MFVEVFYTNLTHKPRWHSCIWVTTHFTPFHFSLPFWKDDLNCTSGTEFPATWASFFLCQKKKKKIKSAHWKADQYCLCWHFCRHLYFAYPIHFNGSNFPLFCQLLMKYHLQHFHLDLPSGINLSGSRTQPTKIIKPKKRQTLINSNMKSNSAAVMSQYRAVRTLHK